jgi:hypothetical protein
VTLKLGTNVCKTAKLSQYGDPTTGSISNTELRLQRARRYPGSNQFDFANAQTWFCEGDEVDRLQVFLNERPGASRYRLIDMASAEADLMRLVRDGEVTAEDLIRLLSAATGRDLIASALQQSEVGLSAAEVAVVAHRRELIRRVAALVGVPGTTETEVQREIGNEWWLFGGRYVGVAERRSLNVLDQYDIPLMGADGTLHIVELKGPDIPRLVVRHRSHLIVGPEVHEAVSQAMNYLRGLDENAGSLEMTYRNEFGQDFDMRRVFATVVIGHPKHVREQVSERQVEQTIRSYNAHLTRVQVVTYKGLLDAAESALAFEARSQEADRYTDFGDIHPSVPEHILGDSGYDEEPF